MTDRSLRDVIQRLCERFGWRHKIGQHRVFIQAPGLHIYEWDGPIPSLEFAFAVEAELEEGAAQRNYARALVAATEAEWGTAQSYYAVAHAAAAVRLRVALTVLEEA